MAVHVECISVIVRVDAINRVLPGGVAQFEHEIVPNQTFACDGELARVAFMSPGDVEWFINQLEALGFVFLRDEKAADIAVYEPYFHQTPSDWLDPTLAWVYEDADSQAPPETRARYQVWACRLRGSTLEGVAFPRNRVESPAADEGAESPSGGGAQ